MVFEISISQLSNVCLPILNKCEDFAMRIIVLYNNTNIGSTNEFISFYLQSLETREERHKSEKTTIIILYWHPRHTAQLVVSKISIHFYQSRPNWSALIRSEKPNRALPQSKLNHPSLKISQIFRTTSFRVRRQPANQFTPTADKPDFLCGGLLWRMMIAISFPRGRKSVHLNIAS